VEIKWSGTTRTQIRGPLILARRPNHASTDLHKVLNAKVDSKMFNLPWSIPCFLFHRALSVLLCLPCLSGDWRRRRDYVDMGCWYLSCLSKTWKNSLMIVIMFSHCLHLLTGSEAGRMAGWHTCIYPRITQGLLGSPCWVYLTDADPLALFSDLDNGSMEFIWLPSRVAVLIFAPRKSW
jgi:hypothetical protein